MYAQAKLSEHIKYLPDSSWFLKIESLLARILESKMGAEYGASIKTEHAFNFLGVFDKVRSC